MSSKSAMVVDDSKSARFALRKSLESRGYLVEAVESAEECYRQLAHAKPDIIFLDHVMPGIDGFSALRHIRADHDSAALPIIICSSHDTPEFLQEAKDIGATDVLIKPPSAEQLDNILNLVAQPASEPASTVVRLQPVGQRVIAAIRSTLAPPPRPVFTDNISAQIAELRQQAAQLEAKLEQEQKAMEAAASAPRENHNLLEELLQRMDALETKVETRLATLQAAIDTGLLMQSERILRVTEAARLAAVENAHQEAERTMMQVAANITDQFMNSLVAALRSGSFKPLLPSTAAKPNPSETIFRQKA